MPVPGLPRKNWTRQAWSQIRSFTKTKVVRMLDKDPRWKRDEQRRGAVLVWYNPDMPSSHNRVTIHFHPGDERFRNDSLLKDILDNICWTEQSLKDSGEIR